MTLKEIISKNRAYFCLDCGKCTGVCPVSRYHDGYSPRMMVTERVNRSAVGNEGLELCLTCKQCHRVCPSDVRYSTFMQELRTEQPDANRAPQCSHGGVLQNLSRLMANGELKQDRLGWVPEEAKTASEGEVLYFTGCLPYFDAYFTHLEADTLRIARDTLRILNHFGVEPVLLEDELCCGHDLLWSGDRQNAEKLAKKNVERIQATGAKTVITACPECTLTMKENWSDFTGKLPFEVVHLSAFIAEKQAEGNLKLKPKPRRKASYQDPCRLSRYLGVTEEPRGPLKEIFAERFEELQHHGLDAVCCGTSGWQHCSATSRQIQGERLSEAISAGADTLVTACPKCQIHLVCAREGDNDESIRNLRIRDLATVVAEAL